MSAFEERMRKIAATMSPEAKEVVRQVITSEYRFRFAQRNELSESFAALALKVAKNDGEE
ncbi:hypothetical protein [Mycolicibacterium vaccae]|nr:hypothetical protein [Mycolicibacterium vaccae]MCV7060828.1 hypothetical protein [Mycolicibacterium vaccae]